MRIYTMAVALLLIALGQPSFSQTPAAEAAPPSPEPAPATTTDNGTLIVFDMGRTFKLNCSNSPDFIAESVSWTRNNTPVEEVDHLRDRHALEQNGAVFHLTARATEDDYGVYECSARGAVESRWNLVAKPVLKLPDDTSAVEGQPLKMTCKVLGKPYPVVSWYYGPQLNESRPVSEVMGARAAFKEAPGGAPGALLAVSAAERSDEGLYYCVAGGAHGVTQLRVKDTYAALWPFLGICAEVLVLCAVILVYERRRAKPELDEDDAADHDQ